MVLGLGGAVVLMVLWSSAEMSVLGACICLVMSGGLVSSMGRFELGGWLYVDMSAVLLMLLSVYISLLMLMSSLHVKRFGLFSKLVISILGCLLGSFSATSLGGFYVGFESVLLPTFILIMGWGYQPERIQAVLYMVVYTVAGSMPLLYGLAKVYLLGGSLCMSGMHSLVYKSVEIFPWMFLIAFFVKLPVFPFHIWLPKAHVEAPVAGSMILAGLLLKLGGYGIIRISSVVDFSCFSLGGTTGLCGALWGGVLTSVACVRQIDLKCLVAYSSIGHMSFVLFGCASNTSLGVLGGLVVMVGHGLCSSGLFAFVNVLYSRSSSRLIALNKGLLLVSPIFSLCCFLLISSNMAAPPSLNLVGEVFVYIVCLCFSPQMVLMLGIMSFMSACYSLYLYVSTQHGSVGEFFFVSKSDYNESLLLLLHWLPLNFLFLVL
uniref:NADH dehydrogenase subunit 4 n=1 Tax=Xenostrobus securis TaxID=1289581 RepID=UPI00226C76F6|nr:NADH dehydrogenase subunit 4 [Xenostrobus securis]UZG65998.1 NADH dehydrogenase subunit 4 [Xenostrobus securis]